MVSVKKVRMQIGFATDHSGYVLKEPILKAAVQSEEVMP
jgi:hypothetical protein